jgi:hypothetical protein
MEIWEPKPPGTLWATPGLLRDPFTFLYIYARVYVYVYVCVCVCVERERKKDRRNYV